MWKTRLRPAPYTMPQYPWDPAISVGAGPPKAVVVVGFDPFIPESMIRATFGSFGEIAELDNKTDPNTGTFLGVCWIKYKDSSPRRGDPVTAEQAARKADKDGTGVRIGLNTVRAERDGTGKRCKRIVEKLVRANRERWQKEMPTQVSKQASEHQHTDDTPAPPPNAPKGPSISAAKLPKGPKQQQQQQPIVTVNPSSSLVEQESVLTSIRRKPYCFIAHESVPVLGTTIPHLKKRLKMYHWEEIRCDQTGYYVVFEDSKRGEDEAVRCWSGTHKQPLFTYTMEVECQQYGNPNYERSPTPERALAEKRQREEQERLQQEEDLDFEEEKRQRALNLDPVMAALEQLREELREKVMGDVKSRIAVPALYEYLDPERHEAKRRRLNIPDPSSEQRVASTYLPVVDDSQTNRSGDLRSNRKHLHASNLSISRIKKESGAPTTNVFQDERRQRPTKRKPVARPLHHRLHDFYADEESDEEQRTSRDDQDSRSISRMSSVAPTLEREDDSEPTPRKQRRHAEREDSPGDEESGDESMGLARALLDPHVLKKEPEDMAMRELHIIISTLPPSSKLHKRAKRERDIRLKTKDDDRLFHVKTDGIEAFVDDGAMLDIVDTSKAVTAKKAKAKKKSKKQAFEEREAAKAAALSAKALLQEVEVTTPEPPQIDEIEVEKAEEEEEEEERAEVEWGVSTEAPRRTVEDDLDMVLDIDGWQHLLKDAEDFQFLKDALADQLSMNLGDANLWAFRQKEIKALNNDGHYGISFEPSQIEGYYVRNETGSARSEGIKKILEAEKSKYLPHRIKVAKAREAREAEAKAGKINPTVPTEAARQAKMASSATSRSNRASNRTHIKDINTAKQNFVAEGQQGDAIRFNQLKKRKKLVKFDRSAIHGWGLYAEENIAQSDMIIEYVGEKVRQAVANVRELRYEKQGMGSSYLFRIDEDNLIDATKKGGIARFINHSCSPNCTAKIIRVDGTKRIVIYAMKEIQKGKIRSPQPTDVLRY